ncbi:MAG: bifunctional glutamate N-acetyltransferase/amino-acid acetyltransferase ArgJ [Deltaproteobacteria bacterium]|nr:bifunctional glutamate N-acetyltransferase/amino-acid acetyltransferase ArgJ [Deltaproteobacteria bacterium]
MNLPKGFSFSGLSCGLKEKGAKDLALIVSSVPARAASAFTQNKVVAAPVLISKKVLSRGLCQAILVNSGNANACTGFHGLQSARRMQTETARRLGISASLVAIASTGKIGMPLPVDKITKALPRLVKDLAPQRFKKAAEAILTTDQFPKVAAFEGRAGGKKYRLVGFAKGAGMIRPDMAPHATMLAFFMTDLAISQKALRLAFNKGIDLSFNRITVDGDTSTNDTALILANGLAGNKSLNPSSKEFRIFQEGLSHVMETLARMMVADGEGATKVVKVIISGAKNQEEARRVAYTVAESPLVKTSFYGQDPNWGRILAAVGRSGATFNPSRTDIYYDSVPVARRGCTTGPAFEKRARKVMRKAEFTATVRLHAGSSSFHVYCSDLTVDYVKLNAHYRT